MRKFLSLIVFLFPILADLSQSLSGTVVDTSGKPIPNSTLYIRELSTGISANEAGQFQIPIPEGIYTIEVRSIGYETKQISVDTQKLQSHVRIAFPETSYQLREVDVRARNEDPAYPIMRKAISMAPFYLKQIEGYESEVYLKGNLKIDKIPRLVDLSIRANQVTVSAGVSA